MGVVISYLKLIRYLNVAIIIATVFISTIFLSHFTDYLQVSVVAFCLAISAAAGNVINDLFDQEIDKVNKPDKVIVGKAQGSFQFKKSETLSVSCHYWYFKI